MGYDLDRTVRTSPEAQIDLYIEHRNRRYSESDMHKAVIKHGAWTRAKEISLLASRCSFSIYKRNEQDRDRFQNVNQDYRSCWLCGNSLYRIDNDRLLLERLKAHNREIMLLSADDSEYSD